MVFDYSTQSKTSGRAGNNINWYSPNLLIFWHGTHTGPWHINSVCHCPIQCSDLVLLIGPWRLEVGQYSHLPLYSLQYPVNKSVSKCMLSWTDVLCNWCNFAFIHLTKHSECLLHIPSWAWDYGEYREIAFVHQMLMVKEHNLIFTTKVFCITK